MNVLVNDAPRVVLLLKSAVKRMFPMSTAALTVAQGTRARLDEEYEGALILDRDGTVRRFDRIDILGTYGSSLPRKVISKLSGVKAIAVTLSAVSMPLSELKSVVITCMQNGGYFDEDADEAERQRILEAVDSAPDAETLFRIFNLGTPEDALDVL